MRNCKVYARYLCFFVLLLFVCPMQFCGCSFLGSSSDKQVVDSLETSTVSDRKKALSKEIKDPRERIPGEILITFSFRPVFSLHMDNRLKVLDFEALNEEGESLKEETERGWKGKRYKKAIRRIIEQAIVDGYISDNNPLVYVKVEQEPMEDVAARRAVISVNREEILQSSIEAVEELAHRHGISAEVEDWDQIE